MVALPGPPMPARMTGAEFMAWSDDPSGRLWQLIDREPMGMAPPSQRHGAIQADIAGLLRAHLRAHRPRCRATTSLAVTPPFPVSHGRA
jgi:Uma2 family endonuclease